MKKKPKEKKKKKSDMIFIILIAVLACVCAFSLYKIITIQLNYSKMDSANEAVVEEIFQTQDESPSSESELEEETEDPYADIDWPDFSYDHDAALEINSDAAGFLYIPATGIQLPVVQGEDNSYYLKHLFDGSYGSAGCLFINANIAEGIDSTHVIIYGHKMRNKSMFGYNDNFLDQSYYETEGNNVFYVYTADYVRQYTIYTVYKTSATSSTYTYNFSSLELLREYAEETKSQSVYDTGVDVSEAEQIVTLSTCAGSGTTIRIIVSGVLTAEKPLS